MLAACSSSPDSLPDDRLGNDTSAPEARVEVTVETAVADVPITGPITAPTTGPEVEEVVESVDEACVDEFVIDEYGREIEISLCPSDDNVTDLPTADEIVARMPPGTSRDGLDAALLAAGNLARACSYPLDWAQRALGVADGVVGVAELVAADPALDGWRGSDDAVAIGVALRNRLILQLGCGETEAAVSSPEVMAAAGRLAGANDDVFLALTGTLPAVFGSEFWYNANSIVHLIDIAQTDEPIDVLMMGPSTSLRGFDPLALTERLDAGFYNASLGALPLDLQMPWYTALTDAGFAALAPTTVVLGVNTWIEFRTCDSLQIDKVDSAEDLRGQAFVSVADAPEAMRLIGGSEPTYSGVLLDANRGVFDPDGRGRALLVEEFDQSVFDVQIEINTTQQVFDAEACPGRVASERALIDRIAADGHDVVLVVLPTSDAMAALHPDGRAGHDASVERYRAIASDIGGRVIDLSDAAPDELFVDLTHLGSPGRDLITDAIVQDFEAN